MAKAAAPAEGDAPAKADGGSKVMIMVGVGVLVAFVAAFLLAKQMMAKPAKHAEKPEVGAHMVLEEFLINLADPGNDRYLKTVVALGLKKEVSEEKFKEEVPVCRDAIVMVLTAKKLEDVKSVEGKTKLKEELVASINKAIGKKDVVEVYLQSFATQ
ncbi:MAG TPA: flagellar basal body-associated FliL family protein [Capsulimonadaceae bacterium]|jgi:flagellar FliL protein